MQDNGKAIKEILQNLGAKFSPAITEQSFDITGVAYDSRNVETGFAFFCIPGEHVDGNAFIPDAFKSGASFVITEQDPKINAVPSVVVPDVREALAQIGAEFYGQPSKKLRLIGITGTNGKTTTTHLVERIFSDAGKKIGLIGTLGARMSPDDEYSDAKHTTPQSADLQRMLSDMVAAGCTHVSMEVSSHALAQKRVGSCEFVVAVLTNVTQDHLDFHKTMDHYWKSKRQLFENLLKGTAILNHDDPLYQQFYDSCKSDANRVSYGWERPADIHVLTCNFESGGTRLKLATPLGELDMKLKLAGKFNVYNVMAAISVCLAEEISLEQIKKSLEAFPGVAGRFEVVSTGAIEEPLCVVDYAHTPDGLENVLKTASNLVPEGGRLCVVFGCGGDRDSSKRPQMGELAERFADDVFVTSDNPRSEDPQQIIGNILAGIQRMKKVKVEADRATAIRLAVSQAGPKDVVLVAGKGHENYQILADKVIPFDDKTEVLTALKQRQATTASCDVG